MAIAARWGASYFNRPGFEMFDYDVYALCGDGCMMEGISSEAASLAGHLKLSNLCWIYDNNQITIEGNTALTFSDDVATRFIGYGWNVTRVGDANDLEMLERAFTTFKNTHDRPTLIIVDSHIAYGAPTQARHQRGPRRTVGRGRDPPDQAALRLAGGRQVPRARRCARAFPGGHRRSAGKTLHAAWWAQVRGVPPPVSGAGRARSTACSAANCPRGGTASLPTFPADPQGHGHPRCLGPGAERPGQERAVAASAARPIWPRPARPA